MTRLADIAGTIKTLFWIGRDSKITATATTDRTYTLPDKSGTFAMMDDVGGGGGATNLAYTASPTNGVVTSDTGTDATLTLADGTNAGLMAPAQHTKLAGVATGATANVGTVTSVAVSVPTGLSVSGSPVTVSGTLALSYAGGYQGYTTTEASKLAGIATAATANSADATLLARANHTGTQAASTISDFSTAADARIAAASINALTDVTITGATNGQVLKYSGGVWMNDADATGGGGGGLTQSQVATLVSMRI